MRVIFIESSYPPTNLFNFILYDEIWIENHIPFATCV